MGTRILIQLDETRHDELPAQVRQLLESAHSTSVGPSHQELPGLYTAIVRDDAKVSELIEQLKRVPGVRHAEVDQFRTTL